MSLEITSILGMNSLIWTGAGGYPADMLISQNDILCFPRSLYLSNSFRLTIALIKPREPWSMVNTKTNYSSGHMHTERYSIF